VYVKLRGVSIRHKHQNQMHPLKLTEIRQTLKLH